MGFLPTVVNAYWNEACPLTRAVVPNTPYCDFSRKVTDPVSGSPELAVTVATIFTGTPMLEGFELVITVVVVVAFSTRSSRTGELLTELCRSPEYKAMM